MASCPWSTALPSIDFDGALFDLVKNLAMPAGATAAVIVLAMVLVAIFFITGADSASIVMASLSSNGSSEPRRGPGHLLGPADRRSGGGDAAGRRR